MLFDLRGRGRRRTIQTIYLFLAVLMGGGLVLFGVGGTGVGVLNNDNSNGGGGGSSANPVSAQLKAAEKRVKVAPRDPAAWADLTHQRFLDASGGKNYDSTKHAYTQSGKATLRLTATAWNRYIALNPKKLDTGLAAQMSTVFGQTGLQDYKSAVTVDEALTSANPKNAAFFSQLALDAALAGQTRKSDLAESQAVALSPKATRTAIKANIDQAKQQAQQAQQQQSQQPTPQLPG